MSRQGLPRPDWAASSRTLTEPSLDEHAPVRRWLVYIGSAETSFADAGRAFSLDGVTKVVFGRGQAPELSAQADDGRLRLEVALPWVSTTHAALKLANGEAVITDLDSRNGVILEDAPVSETAGVEDGAVFEIGRSFWMLRTCSASIDLRRGFGSLHEGTSSPALWSVLHALSKVASANLPLLLTGETGTGKGTVARAVHGHGGRPGPLVHLNLAGARAMEHFRQREPGELRRATAHGTLLLDDVGELGIPDQTELLATLIREFDDRQRPTTRIVSTTSRDLRRLLAQDAFRPDLYARLAGFTAHLVPVRDRREDLGRLARAALPSGDPPAKLGSSAFRRMLSHRWPFNVRQVHQCLQAAHALAAEPPFVDRQSVDKVLGPDADPARTPEEIRALRHQLLDALREHANEIDAVARAFDCAPEQIERLLHSFDIPVQEFS